MIVLDASAAVEWLLVRNATLVTTDARIARAPGLRAAVDVIAAG